MSFLLLEITRDYEPKITGSNIRWICKQKDELSVKSKYTTWVTNGNSVWCLEVHQSRNLGVTCDSSLRVIRKAINSFVHQFIISKKLILLFSPPEGSCLEDKYLNVIKHSDTAWTNCLAGYANVSTLCSVSWTSKWCIITILSTALQEIKSQVRIVILLLSHAALLERLEGLCKWKMKLTVNKKWAITVKTD